MYNEEFLKKHLGAKKMEELKKAYQKERFFSIAPELSNKRSKLSLVNKYVKKYGV